MIGLRSLLLLAVALIHGLRPATAADPPENGTLRVYFGTYTGGGKSKGIYLSELDLKSGALTTPKLVAETADPSFLAIAPNHRFLYAVSEVSSFDGQNSGAVAAFALNPQTGGLEFLNKQSSHGTGPCHLVVDREGKNVLVANYGGGSVATLPIDGDGKLREASAAIQHKGSGPDSGRQEGPHAHSINLDKANRFAVAADLGLDKLLVYRFDSAKGSLVPNDPPSASVAPGAGPRHFAFHPDGRHAYVINEMHLTVTALDYDPERGTLKEIQTISTVPAGVNRRGLSTAEVQVHPSGKFLYGSNRGHDTLAIFSIDPASGRLTVVGHQSTGGKTPRNFGIDPTGRYVLAANQGSDTVTVFRVDTATGKLEPTGQSVSVPAAVCVKMIPKE
jgi:6-phosphogluconolactonase